MLYWANPRAACICEQPQEDFKATPPRGRQGFVQELGRRMGASEGAGWASTCQMRDTQPGAALSRASGGHGVVNAPTIHGELVREKSPL